ncbi:hypothetical protein AS589_09380 [Empedobacter brevis]|uniref:hypothetical protein n=1 Tax=Empedobacter brevis TaxID=247 RepID=UPI0013201FAD|nr:hypothetical protein [Empedobacter brevis]QHC84967.1 hypothetical protein AS589_09380 [Empedobacter brevis]
MKPQELRIGNCLFDPEENKNVLIEGVDIFLIQMEHPRESKYEPITLTEEILLKCGYSEYDLDIGRIILTEDGGFIITRLSQNVTLKTLHQLQNLYFALTNKELEIKM